MFSAQCESRSLSGSKKAYPRSSHFQTYAQECENVHIPLAYCKNDSQRLCPTADCAIEHTSRGKKLPPGPFVIFAKLLLARLGNTLAGVANAWFNKQRGD